MFSTLLAVYAGVALTAVTTATPAQTQGGAIPVSQCNTGSIQCCDSTFTEGSAGGTALLGLIGVVVQDVNALVGQGCSPLSVVGVGNGATCTANPVCCEDNSNSLISVGCVPIDLNL
ncbi:hypothetical protein EIP91_010268 [Steccherinum ochraceum]|uniref:Hydrophobin n=1 Tax=Steccherinum ochraceum TaxID=92696 RepID=A0A4R0RNH1_9APHY|nr:hypothetical protein EIP91_010268 [Steccherinum ochraceum]